MRRALVLAAVLATACAACSQEPQDPSATVPEVTEAQVSPLTTASVEAPSTTAPVAPSMTVSVSPSSTDAVEAPSTTASVAPSTTVSVEAPSTTASVAPSTTAAGVGRERPNFVEGAAPGWPFRGVVQLWPDYDLVEDADGSRVGLRLSWSLRYWSWEASPDRSYPQVELPGLRIACLGQMALVHDERGVEVGGASGAASAAFRVPWGETARELVGPSEALLAEAASRPSNVAVASGGDWVRLGSGDAERSYAMRDPARPDGERWSVQARHDGELFMWTVHPAHLPCYSGVTWLSLADTGEFVMCGANSAATAFVTPEEVGLKELVLPDPAGVGDYLSCAAQLYLREIPLTADRRLS